MGGIVVIDENTSWVTNSIGWGRLFEQVVDKLPPGRFRRSARPSQAIRRGHRRHRACDLATEAGLPLGQLVSDQFALKDYGDALLRARRGEGYKLQILPARAG